MLSRFNEFMHDLHISLVTYNSSGDLRACLDSLFLDLATSPINAVMTVVDNASTDGSLQIIKEKFPKIKFFELPKNSGFGKAHNVALAQTDAKYHFVLNPDTVFPKGLGIIRRLYDFMEAHPQVAMVGPKLI